MKQLNLCKRRGSMTVEAALCLPVYICGVLTLIALVKLCFLQVLVYSAAADEIKLWDSGLVVFPEISISNLLDSEGIDGDGFEIDYIDQNLEVDGRGGFAAVSFSYGADLTMPVSLINSVNLENTIICRPWKGLEMIGQPFDFNQMTIDESGNTVFLFPQAGEKYHQQSCRYVNSYPVETRLTRDLMKKYSSCSLCDSSGLSMGSRVYVFKYGSSYHRNSCSSIEKYVIEMDREDAVLKGYSACSVCGG